MLAAGVMAAEVPQWVTAAAAQDSKGIEGAAAAVDLLREKIITVSDDGRQRLTERRVMRCLSARCQPHAVARVVYVVNQEKVKNLVSWLVGPGGMAITAGKRDAADVALVDNDLYSEVRVRRITAFRIEPGQIFAWEAEVEEEPLFGDVVADLQGALPVVRSRLTVVVPAGWTWRVRSTNLDAGGLKAEGNQLTWEVANRTAVEPEPMAPSPRTAFPRVALGLVPPGGSTAPRAFAEWKDVGLWIRSISEAQAEPNEEIRAKAAELTAGLSREYDKIEAVSRFVQKIRYVSIQTGLGRGGGYRPNAAATILTRLQGDCKDKVTLLRSLLRAVGISSYLVLISTEDGYAQKDWPSPQQFNHAIAAIAVSREFAAEAAVDTPEGGRLLLFDPTDSVTPLGRLPENEEDNLALVVTPQGGILVTTRAPAAASNKIVRSVEYQLSPAGDLSAKVKEERLGGAAMALLATQERAGAERVREGIRTEYGRTVVGAKFGQVHVEVLPGGASQVDVQFFAQGYAKLLQQKMLVFGPPDLGGVDNPLAGAPPRRLPLRVSGLLVVAQGTLATPAGFAVDEVPDPVTRETEVGSFASRWSHGEGQLLFESRLEIRPGMLPAARAGEVAEFLAKVREAARAPVVLVKK